jgi:RNA polymerase sigma-70 factor (ECF subfamily)
LPERSSLVLARQLLARGSTPSERLNQEELVRRVRQAVSQLPEMDREVLLMRTFEGLSFEEVAWMLKIDPAAARKRHGRALLRLGKILSEFGLKESDL